MLNWLKLKTSGKPQKWLRAQEQPWVKIPFPKGAKLKPLNEEVVLGVPMEVTAPDDAITSVFLCDDDAELGLNEKVGLWYVRLKPGVSFCLSKSCEIMLLGKDSADGRPRSFLILRPDSKLSKPAASPSGGPAEQFGIPQAGGGPPTVN